MLLKHYIKKIQYRKKVKESVERGCIFSIINIVHRFKTHPDSLANMRTDEECPVSMYTSISLTHVQYTKGSTFCKMKLCWTVHVAIYLP